MSDDIEMQRHDLERRLAAHRERIGSSLAPVPRSQFPRSRIMQLLLTEHLLLAAASAVAATLLGPRLRRMLPVAVTLFRYWRSRSVPPHAMRH